jgi:predicted PurR-regulated permease PerM
MVIAGAISSGWVAFLIGVVIAAVLVAVVGRYSGRGPIARRA